MISSALIFDHSHHKLKIRGLQSPVDVLTFEGREQLSTPFRYDIEFTSTDKAIAPESVLMQDGAFSLTAPPVQGMPVQAPLRTLYGVITGFKHLSTSRDETRYEVRLEPRMALLARSRQNAIYQNLTVPQIVEKILRERHQMRGQDFVFNLKSAYPAREQVMQYGEDDLTFISRLLSEVGIWFRFATDARLKIEVVEFYDDQSGYERGLTLPLRHPSGLFDGETEAVWGLNTAYSVVEKSVTTRDYNYREATAEMMTEQHDATGGDNTTYGEAYHYADNFLQKGDKEAAESGAFYARIRHERYLNEQAILKGQSTSSLLTPGLEIRVQGDDAPAVFRKGVLITGGSAPENDIVAIRELRPTRLLIVDATDMGLNPGEIRIIDPDDIAEMFMMTTHNMPLNYLIDQLKEDIGEVIFLGIQPDIVGFYYPMTQPIKDAVETVYQRLEGWEGNGGFAQLAVEVE